MIKFKVNENEFENASEVAEYITDNLSDDFYDDMLDECYNEINICGLSYSPSIALYHVDEIAYNCGKNDYYDSLASDIEYELERMCDGETTYFYGFEVECIEEEEEEEEEEKEEL